MPDTRRRSLRSWFSNGGKISVASGAVATAALLVAMLSVYDIIGPSDAPPFVPVRVEGPVLVRSREPDLQKASLPAGGGLVWTRTICNDSDQDVTGIGTGEYVSIGEPITRVAAIPAAAALSIPPGCDTGTVTLPLPPGVVPGVWLLRATANVYERGSGRAQIVVYDTEPFLVVEAPRAAP